MPQLALTVLDVPRDTVDVEAGDPGVYGVRERVGGVVWSPGRHTVGLLGDADGAGDEVVKVLLDDLGGEAAAETDEPQRLVEPDVELRVYEGVWSVRPIG